MPHEAHWTGQVFTIRLIGDVTLPEGKMMVQRFLEGYNPEAECCYILLDQTEQTSGPLNLGLIKDNLRVMREAKICWLIACGHQNKILVLMTSIIAQWLRVKFKGFDTFQEGKNFLQSLDSSPEVWT